MKQIRVKYFAAYREATGLAEELIDTEASTAAELFAEMASRHDNLAEFSGAMVAINDEMASWDASIADSDQILFFPPVAGG